MDVEGSGSFALSSMHRIHGGRQMPLVELAPHLLRGAAVVAVGAEGVLDELSSMHPRHEDDDGRSDPG
jgi:hypothetical protein